MNTTLILDTSSQLTALGGGAFEPVMEYPEASLAVGTLSPVELLRRERDAETAQRSVVAAGGEGALRYVSGAPEVHAVQAGLGHWSTDPALGDLGD